ncbi:MAG: replication initiator protein A [Leuconostoc mesenteroides]|uniref:replication initiator protein A n=1 Tax=Leuconostoc falkenbergense TaxID=2766470 RepID=UPI003F964510
MKLANVSLKFPKALFTYEFYKPMSLAAKTAYAILKDRFELSVQNGWADGHGAVFLLYTIAQIGEILGCKKDKVIQQKKN